MNRCSCLRLPVNFNIIQNMSLNSIVSYISSYQVLIPCNNISWLISYKYVVLRCTRVINLDSIISVATVSSNGKETFVCDC